MPEAYLEQRILTADPVELIQILYEQAIRFVQEARGALAAQDIVARSKAISRTIGILGELEGSLDQQVGGPVSQNLAALYRYMRTRLTLANLKQEDGPLAEVEDLLQTVGSAWKTLARNPVQVFETVPAAAAQAEMGDPRFLPDTNSPFSDHGWTA